MVSFPQVSDEKAWSPELKGGGNGDVYSIVSMLVLEAIPPVSCQPSAVVSFLIGWRVLSLFSH